LKLNKERKLHYLDNSNFDDDDDDDDHKDYLGLFMSQKYYQYLLHERRKTFKICRMWAMRRNLKTDLRTNEEYRPVNDKA
jgi:hypothetical protein